MACFTVPLAEALIVSAVKAVAFRRNADSVISEAKKEKLAEIKENIKNLEKMLYGGSFLLAIEHIYHGEVVLYPPFLTAMNNPEDIHEMLHEMATVGVGMAVLVTAVWCAAVGIRAIFRKLSKGSGRQLQGAL